MYGVEFGLVLSDEEKREEGELSGLDDWESGGTKSEYWLANVLWLIGNDGTTPRRDTLHTILNLIE